jgi:hypothetical protein
VSSLDALPWFHPSRRFDRYLARNIETLKLEQELRNMTTPSAIDRITEHARRASALLKATDKAGEIAGPTLDAYEESLKRFNAGVADVDAKRKALDAALPAFGNAAGILDSAFQDEKTVAAKSSNGVEQQVIKPEDVGTLVDVAVNPMPPGSR